MEFKLLYIYKPPAKLPSLPNKCKLIYSPKGVSTKEKMEKT